MSSISERIRLLTSPEAQDFVRTHLHEDVSTLALRPNPLAHIPYPWLLEQIDACQKAAHKLPLWAAQPEIIYTKLALEQCSSALTAAFKAEILEAGSTIVDLSGGFGVDSFYFAQHYAHVHHVEPNADLQTIVAHNFEILGLKNVIFHSQNAEKYLRDRQAEQVDAMYLDPSRRNDAQKRLVRLEDCQPDVLSLMPAIRHHTPRIFIKTAPLLDIKDTLQRLGSDTSVWVVSVANEVKEVLYLCQQGVPARYYALNLLPDGSRHTFEAIQPEHTLDAPIGSISEYLYEPMTSVMKLGSFKAFATQYGLTKLHPHTHLYTHNACLPHVPARVFRVEAVCKYDKKTIRTHLHEAKAHISLRNFPGTVAEVRQKLGLGEGGEYYLFGARDATDKLVMIVTRKAECNKKQKIV